MHRHETIAIDGHIIELEIEFDQYYDSASGENVLYTDFVGFDIISVVDTNNEELFTENFKEYHKELVSKWMELYDIFDL